MKTAMLALALSGLAELQENFSVGRELGDLHAFAVHGRRIGDPNISVAINGHLVRLDEKSLAEILHRLAVGRELEHGLASRFLATIDHPEIVVAIDGERVFSAQVGGEEDNRASDTAMSATADKIDQRLKHPAWIRWSSECSLGEWQKHHPFRPCVLIQLAIGVVVHADDLKA